MTASHVELPLIGKIKHPSRWLIGLAAAGVVVVGSTTYFVAQQTKPKLDIAQLTVPVESKNVTLRINASGKVVPVQSVNISPKTSGVLVDLLVEQGDSVKAGQIIARMDSSDLQAQLLQTRAKLAQAQAQLDKAVAGSRPEEIAQAQARLDQAQAQLEAARSGRPEEIEQAQAQVDAAQARVNLASSRVERNRQLYREGAISQDKLDEVLADDRSARASLTEAQRRLAQVQEGSRTEEIAQRQAAVAEAKEALQQLKNGTRSEDIAEARAAVNGARGELKAVQVKLEDTIVRAPFTGIVTQKYATEGAFVTPTTSASSTASATSSSIVAIAHGLEVLAQVPEADIGRIEQGQQVEVVADSFPDRVFKGRVRLISPEAVVEQNVTSFQVRVALDSGKDKLLSGMNVDLTFLGANLKNAMIVPTVAIVTESGKTGVLVPGKNDLPEFRSVTIGSSIQDQTQILSGLNGGDRVFINLPKDRQPKTNDE